MKPHNPNNPTDYSEQLSALMDGELAEGELAGLLDAVEHDPKLRKLWGRMHAARNLLTKQSQSSFNTDIAASVMSKVVTLAELETPSETLDETLSEDLEQGLEKPVSLVGSKPSVIPFSRSTEITAGGSRTAEISGESGALRSKPFYHVAAAAAVAFITVVSFNGWQNFQENQKASSDVAFFESSSIPDNVFKSVYSNDSHSIFNDTLNNSPLVPLVASGSSQAFDGRPSANAAALNSIDPRLVGGSSESQVLSPRWIKPLQVESSSVEGSSSEAIVQSEPVVVHASVSQAVWEQVEPFVMTHTVYAANQTGSGVFSFGRTLDGGAPMKPIVIKTKN